MKLFKQHKFFSLLGIVLIMIIGMIPFFSVQAVEQQFSGNCEGRVFFDDGHGGQFGAADSFIPAGDYNVVVDFNINNKPDSCTGYFVYNALSSNGSNNANNCTKIDSPNQRTRFPKQGGMLKLAQSELLRVDIHYHADGVGYDACPSSGEETMSIVARGGPSNGGGTTPPPPGGNCSNQVFLTDSAGKDWGNGATVKLNATGYAVKAKIEKCDDGYPFHVRVYEIVNGKTTEPPVIPPKSGNSKTLQTFTSPKKLVFDKNGTYVYYLDYQDDNKPNDGYKNINTLTIQVGDQPTNNNTNTTGNPNANVNTNTSAAFIDLDQKIDDFVNPLQIDTLPQLLGTILRILFALTGMIAVVIIIVAGFRMVLASGNTDQLTKARSAITWAIVGLIVSLMAFSIVAIIQKLIQG